MRRVNAVRCLGRLERFVDVGLCDSGLFDYVSDDVIAKIYDHVLNVSVGSSVSALQKTAASHMDVVSLAVTNRRMYSVFCGVAVASRKEALSRASTVIAPRDVTKHPFTNQVENEERSGRQLRLLKQANQSMACHCAGACCTKFHKILNRDLKKYEGKRALECVIGSSAVVATTPDGNVLFLYQRNKTSKRSLHGEERGRRFVDQLVRLERSQECQLGSFVRTATHELDITQRSAPLRMSASACGSSVAFICSLHDVDGNDVPAPFSAAFVWIPGSDLVMLSAPGGMPGPAMSPQDLAFGNTTLSVAWSTDFVHPSGHFMGSNAAPEDQYASYRIANYNPAEEYELDEATSVYNGRLTSCSWTSDAREVLVITKTTEPARRRPARSAMLHQPALDVRWPLGLRATPARKDGCIGPLCATISPTGDCIASMHRTASSVQMLVSVRSSDALFTVVKTIDMTPFLMLSPVAAAPSDASDFVRACYAVGFSYCGRFATVLDRRAFFGGTACNHGLVVVDLAQRLETCALRAQPLFSTDDQAPRSVNWTKNGFFLQAPGTDEYGTVGPKGGLLFLRAA